MKKSLTKLIVSCAAVTAVAAAMAVSASAATCNATYNNGNVDLDATALPSAGQNTILVIEGTYLTAAINNNTLIKYINQADATAAAAWLDTIPVGTLNVDENAYTVLVGGENVEADGILKATFGKTEGGETGDLVDALLGDVNRDDTINNSDSLLVLQHFAGIEGKEIVEGSDEFKLANIDGNDVVNNSDSLRILQHFAGIEGKEITGTVKVSPKAE